MREIKSAVIFQNAVKRETELPTLDIADFISGHGIRVEVIKLTRNLKDSEVSVPEVDLAVSIGGDGTVLSCVNFVCKKGIPVIPVNLGTFGFITDTNVMEFREVFSDYINGITDVQERMMLDVYVNGAFFSRVLNDVVVGVTSRAKVASLSLDIDFTHLSVLRCDGIIVSTPTGSTAYSLSAGGPVLDTSLNAIVVNQICPFTLSARPLVVSGDSVIQVVAEKNQRVGLNLTADGRVFRAVNEDDVITVTKSAISALFVKNKKRNFINVLGSKLLWSGGFNA